MANYKTGAQRYNDRMDKIFAKSKELNEKYHGKDSFGSGDHRSEAMKKSQAKSKALINKKGHNRRSGKSKQQQHDEAMSGNYK